MNKQYAIRNLEEAKEHLEAIINKLNEADSIDPLNGELRATVLDMYWKINRIWNARNISQINIDNCDEKQFDQWCKFPNDLDDI